MNNIFLSIIIPVYNVEKYIRRTLESIEKQRRDLFDFEVIVVDDGTPDSSMEIVEEFHEIIPNLITIHQKNQGLSGARNTGLQQAQGKFIWFVDSDDTITPDAFEIVKEQTQTEAEIYAFDMYKIHEGSGGRMVETMILNNRDFKLYDSLYPGTSLHRKIHNGAVQRYIFTRKFLEENCLEFLPGIYFEDIEFLTRAQLYAKRILPINKPIYNYLLRNEGSIMTSFRLKHLQDAFKIIDSFKNFYKYKAKTKREKAMIGDVVLQQIYRVMCWDEKKIKGYDKFIKSRFLIMRHDALYYGIRSLLYFSMGKVIKIVLCVIAPRSLFQAKIER